MSVSLLIEQRLNKPNIIKLLVDELKTRRANGETNIIIQGDNIITRHGPQRQPHTSETTKEAPRSMTTIPKFLKTVPVIYSMYFCS